MTKIARINSLVLACLLILLQACGGAQPDNKASSIAKPVNLLNEEQMKTVLKEIHFIEAHENLANLTNKDSIKKSDVKTALHQYLDHEGISDETFITSFNYYRFEESKLMLEMYEEIELEIESEMTAK